MIKLPYEEQALAALRRLEYSEDEDDDIKDTDVHMAGDTNAEIDPGIQLCSRIQVEYATSLDHKLLPSGVKSTWTSGMYLDRVFDRLTVNTSKDRSLKTAMSPWRVCQDSQPKCNTKISTFHHKVSSDGNILTPRTLYDSCPEGFGKKDVKSYFSESERNPHGLWPYFSRHMHDLNHASKVHGKGTGIAATNTHTTSKKQPSARKKNKTREKSLKSGRKRTAKRTASAENRPEKQTVEHPINYAFSHTSAHKGHMQQYRDSVTKPNLRHALLSCARTYFTTDEHVSKAYVECDDVREGACVRPTIKVSHYKFDMQHKLRTAAILTKNLRRRIAGTSTPPHTPTSPQTKAEIDQMFSLVGMPPSMGVKKASSTSSSHSHQKPGLCPVATPLTNPLINPISPVPSNIPSGNNPLVSRSRPSIPSNSRGKICPTAVETGPVHVVACIKGQSIERKTPSAPPSLHSLYSPHMQSSPACTPEPSPLTSARTTS